MRETDEGFGFALLASSAAYTQKIGGERGVTRVE
jgi:hypothetical protein